MATLRAKRLPQNQPVVFFTSMADLRAANGQDPDLTYLEAFLCPAQDGYVQDSAHAFRGPDRRLYHSRDCAEVAAIMEEMPL